MEQNYLYKFDFNILYHSKVENNGVLKCSPYVCDLARTRVSKRDSLLFDQIKQLKDEGTGLEEIIVIIDFTDFINKHKMTDLSNIEEIELVVFKIENYVDGEENIVINVRDFLKSNSMSKDCQVYYINDRVVGKNGKNLYSELLDRVFFGFQNQKTVLSKLYAYSGTLCSDCTLLDNIRINSDEIVVVDDKRWIEKSDCITMISPEYLYTELKKVKDYLNDSNITLEKLSDYNAILEFKSLLEAVKNPINQLSNEIVDFLNEYDRIEKNNLRKFKDSVTTMVEKYAEIETRVDEVNWERIEVKDYPFDLCLFDGEGLISKEFCDEIRESLCEKLGSKKYAESTSFQIRLPYIKGMVHSCDFKAFFKEKGICDIKHIQFNNGKKYDLNNIKRILTKSQFKAEAFIRDGVIKSFPEFIDVINSFNYRLGVIDANKKRNNLCSLEYQFISTIPFRKDDIRTIYSDNKWRIYNLYQPKNIIRAVRNEETDMAKKELDMLNANQNFYLCTKKFRARRLDVFTRLKTKAIFCKFDVLGSRRYLSGDLLEFLYYIAYDNNDAFTSDLWLRKNQFYMPSMKSVNYKAVFLRSPHYSRNEIAILNRRPVSLIEEREKYFYNLKGIVMINPRSLVAERLGGADYDGDTVLIVRDKNVVNPVLNEMIKYSEGKFAYEYLPCKIPSLKGMKSHYNDYNNRLVCFQNTFSSRVGQLSNEAIINASIIYDKPNSNDNNHSRIADYTILNGLEIDSAKSGRKPKIIFSSIEDKYHIGTFLEAKKEYDISRSSQTIKRLYDIYDFDEEEWTYGGNISAFVSIMSKLEMFETEEYKMPRKDDVVLGKTDSLDYPKALAISSIYSNSMKLIRHVISDKAKQMKRTLMGRIYNQLESIIKKKNMDINDFLDSFDMDNSKAYRLLKVYLEDNSYHYLTDDDSKKEYLKNLFGDDIDNRYDYFLDFSNDGFRLLFIYLNYYLNKITRVELITSASERKKLDYKIETLSDEEKEKFNIYYGNYENDINEIISKNKDLDEVIIKDKIINYLKQESQSISFGDIRKAVDIFDSPIVYDVFFDKVIKSLGVNNGQ